MLVINAPYDILHFCTLDGVFVKNKGTLVVDDTVLQQHWPKLMCGGGDVWHINGPFFVVVTGTGPNAVTAS